MSTRDANLLPRITNDPALTEETAREAHRLLGGTEGIVKECCMGLELFRKIWRDGGFRGIGLRKVGVLVR